ncbi:SDR family NAD(P)-dependent oxidoreductase [Streptomyces anulatus]|uniref:SDR family NAD(P)-dependent oxidoreductase n=1 Tax=Streptomyces anulatus TaxID=1892 RepID=UPI003723870C
MRLLRPRRRRISRGSWATPSVAAGFSAPDAADRLFDDVEARLGPVDVLVNNAAHCESPDTVDALTAAGLERHYRVNVTAPALLTSALAHRARDGRSPCVVNIATDAARAATAAAQTWPRSELTQRSGRRVITTCSPWFSQAKST